MDQIYRHAIARLRLQGRTSDYHAGRLRRLYELKRRLYGAGVLGAAAGFVLVVLNADSRILHFAALLLVGMAFAIYMRQVVQLGHAIDRVSRRSPDHWDEFTNDFLAPYPELHQLFLEWRSEGSLWDYDSNRLIELAEHASAAGPEKA